MLSDQSSLHEIILKQTRLKHLYLNVKSVIHENEQLTNQCYISCGKRA